MIATHKIRLVPNREQETFFKKSCGVARFAYNWALAQWNEDYAWDEKPTAFSIRKKLNAIKKEQFPWMREVCSYGIQQAVLNLGDAFKRFFKKQGRYPRIELSFVENVVGKPIET